jgi:hypothetical protein
MPITVTQEINEAYYASGIYSRNFETVAGNDFNFGLQIFNDLLAEKLINDKMIPYYTMQNFTGVIGQEQYDITNLIEVDTLTFVINTVRFPVRMENRADYFGTARANNVNSLPFSWHLERTLNGASMFVYFKPQTAYTFEIWGKFGLTAVTDLDEDLLLTYDRYYVTYLKYELAERLCAEFNMEVPLGVQQTLFKLKKQISKKSAILDLELSNTSTLGRQSALNWAQINLGHAWTAP